MPMEIADVFSGDAFSAVTLTDQINNTPYTPNLLGSLGNRLYAVDGVRTKEVAVNEKNGRLEIISTSPRGSAPGQIDKPKQNLNKKVDCSHLALEAEVNADEVQNALNYAASSGQPQLKVAQDVLTEQLEGPFGLRARFELTMEYQRLGGIKGIVVDKDASEIYNWYNYFGISPMADGEFDLNTIDPDETKFEDFCRQLQRDMLVELEGLPTTNITALALCGDNYYDRAWGNKEVVSWRKALLTGSGLSVFGTNKAFSSFTYGGIQFVNYRGTKDGDVGIGTDEARLFPVDCPGLFQMLFGPPDIMGMTNMKGLPLYAFMPPSRQTERLAVVEAQSNPLTMCIRPRALRRLAFAA
ncbi:major capsid protein [Azospirillum sp. B4]|uniref:major capsid protein n=1 Tax=Azospirillum sp. B4 TaxID=95605 RepID=UPI00034846F7|nr:major capsid protein [Azospirillum sp. B4]